MNSFQKVMKDKHNRANQIEHLKKTIEHCISVIAICRMGGQTQAEASYEARLKQLNEEFQELLQQQQEIEESEHENAE
jgi:hypothetical protein